MDPSSNKLPKAPRLDGPEDYHVFIANSESDEDRLLVEKITTPLKTMRFKWIDPGSFYTQDEHDLTKVEKGVMRSKHVLILLTKAFLEKAELLTLVLKTSQIKVGESHHGSFLTIALGDVTDGDVPEELRDYKKLAVGSATFEAELCQILANTTTLEMAALPVSGIARGLAWSYFYGYLRMLLPGLPERYKKFGVWKEPKGQRVMPLKMFILIPGSCYCPRTLTDADEKFKPHPEKIPFSATRAGCQNRNYDTTVYSVEDDDGQFYYVQIEFATPVLSIWEMYYDEIAGMRESEKNHQLLVFYDVLRDILNHEQNKPCRDKAVLLYYDDADTEVPLSRIVLDRIKKEIARDLEKEEKPVGTEIEVDGGEVTNKEKLTYNDLSQQNLPSYDMQLTKQKRGRALVISITEYDPIKCGFKDRAGGEVDDEKMRQLWTDLGFMVEVVINPTGKGIMSTATRLAMEDHTNYKAFVCCIHGHGDLGVVYGSDGKDVKFTDITHLFSEEVAKGLTNKPKMFFIQACQGRTDQWVVIKFKTGYVPPILLLEQIKDKNTHLDGVKSKLQSGDTCLAPTKDGAGKVSESEAEIMFLSKPGEKEMAQLERDSLAEIYNKKEPGEKEKAQLERDLLAKKYNNKGSNPEGARKNLTAKLVPGHKDFVMSYATLPGRVSYRHTGKGSYYINSLDKNIRDRTPGMEIDIILKKVSHEVEMEMKKLLEHEKVPDGQYPFHLTTTNKRLYL